MIEEESLQNSSVHSYRGKREHMKASNLLCALLASVILRWLDPAYFCENLYLYLYIFVLSFICSDSDLSS